MSIARVYVLAGADPVLCEARITAMQDAMSAGLRGLTVADVAKGSSVLRISWGVHMVDASMQPPQFPRTEPETMLLTLRHLRRTNNRWDVLAQTGHASILFGQGTAVPTDKALEVLGQAVAWAAKRLGAPVPEGPGAAEPEAEGPSPAR